MFLLRFACVSLCWGGLLLVLLAEERATPSVRGFTTAGKTASLQSISGDSPDRWLVTTTTQQTHPLLSQSDLVWPIREHHPLSAERRLHLTLATGDCISGAPVEVTSSGLQLRIAGQQTVTLPWTAIQVLEHAPGWRVLLCDTSDSPTGAWKSTGATPVINQPQHVYQGRSATLIPFAPTPVIAHWPAPVSQGRVSVWFWNDPAAKARWNWELDWGTPAQPCPVRVTLPSDMQSYRVEAPALSHPVEQRLPCSAGWHQLTVEASGRKLRVLVDDIPLLVGDKPPGGQCSSCRWGSSQASPTATEPGLWVDELLVAERVEEPLSSPVPQGNQETLQFATGEEQYGHWQGGTWPAVQWDTPLGLRTHDWSAVARIVFAKRTLSPVPVHGLQAALRSIPVHGDAHWEQRFLHVALQQATDNHWRVRHPLLGELNWPVSELQHVRPDFLGTSIVLSGLPVHLGDEIKTAFQQPVPVGTEQRFEFTLAKIPAGQPRLSALVADLEPGGHWASTRSRYLADIRAGRLVTQWVCNERLLGTLNELTAGPGSALRPAKLSVAVPPSVLQTGTNRVVIRGVSNGAILPEYDDIELLRLQLEFVESP